MKYQFNDGGRAEAGFKGTADDCVARALAIVLQRPYGVIYDYVNEICKQVEGSKPKSSARKGVSKKVTKKIMESLGLVWYPTMIVGEGCTVHLRENELPTGRIIVSVTKHVTAVVDGVLHDNHDCARDGQRCVYGYWWIKK